MQTRTRSSSSSSSMGYPPLKSSDQWSVVSGQWSVVIETDSGVEFLDQGVDRFDLTLDAGPVSRVLPLGQDFLVGFPLLLDPRVVLQVVDAPPVGVPQIERVVGVLAQQIAGEVGGGVELGVLAMFGMHLREAAPVQLHRVGQDGQHQIV